MAKWTAPLLALVLCSSGCLARDMSATWVLDASTGLVTWSVLEDHVRSDADSTADRYTEENDYRIGRAVGHPWQCPCPW